ncbi:MAG: hypothetical protein KJ063_02415 [Anaerolineae bacterium]|nr:hypothetical protein [Anaerolineae bacterium]
MAKKKTQMVEGKTYFLVNPAGAVHEVNHEIAKARLNQVGYRIATPAEVAALQAMGGTQTIGQVAGRPHQFDPETILESASEE